MKTTQIQKSNEDKILAAIVGGYDLEAFRAKNGNYTISDFVAPYFQGGMIDIEHYTVRTKEVSLSDFDESYTVKDWMNELGIEDDS